MRVRRRSKRALYIGLGIFVAMFLFSFLVQKFKTSIEVDAVSMAGFDPGYIISDYQMSNYNSMNEGQIQDFLKAKNSCNDTNIDRYTGGQKVDYFSEMSPPVTWHVKDGHFVCMADEVFDGGTAAHIIYQASQDYQINPQVLLVLLEKEQSLIRDTFPHSQQYRSATGYGCPDTAACSSKYYGLNNQIRNAAALFRMVLNGGWTNYPLGNNYIQYNPNPSCGGSVVNVRNLATSALYRYTPYQPNAATLGGWNDGCNAYGNMNFYKLFEEWFGGITWEGWLDVSVVLSNNRVKNEPTDLDLTYETHIQHYGWLPEVNGGEMAGTAGYAARLEAFKIKLDCALTGIEYRTYVQGIGWTDYVRDGAISGTIGEARQVEAAQIRLIGDIAKLYDVLYRVHVQGIGWTDWVKNDELAGTTGQSKRIEAIQVKLARKHLTAGPIYLAHVQSIGWMDWARDGATIGTVGQSKRIEAIKIELSPEIKNKGGVIYHAHVQDYGWMDWVKNGELAGTTGQSKRMEAIEIKLADELTDGYDIYYRVHVQDYGWMDWVKNGELAGTTGQSKRMEAIEIELVKK